MIILLIGYIITQLLYHLICIGGAHAGIKIGRVLLIVFGTRGIHSNFGLGEDIGVSAAWRL